MYLARILIVYDSRTGNTEKMANAVAEGATEVEGATTTMMHVDKAKIDDFLAADAIVLGSPTYYGNMSGKMKELIDQTFDIHGKLEGKVGGAFTSSGGTACGAETTLLAMLQAMLVHGMIVQGRNDNKHYGTAAIEEPDEDESKLCREQGNRVASLTVALKG